ncbi:MAG: hypothetical protein ORN98_03215, partial [Alphaproteobacteria bacterium]|nr:hypothetical protein [Alphaproteobacteria bacterium]
MSTHEHTINDALAALLRTTRRAWEPIGAVCSETNGLIDGNATRPDMMVIEEGASPVVIENEIIPNTRNLEDETRARLGQTIKDKAGIILSAVAIRTPERMRSVDGLDLTKALRQADDFDMALFTGNNPHENVVRWPESGWLSGGLLDLSLLVQGATVPPAVVEAAANKLELGIASAESIISDMAKKYKGTVVKISREMKQTDNVQTRRMAAAILVNAFIFHELLGGHVGGLEHIQGLMELKESKEGLNKLTLHDEWQKILEVNYWPIFHIASKIMTQIHVEYSERLINSLQNTAFVQLSKNLTRSHDLMGAVFQRLISDRKFLAAFYTTPAAAALLVGLALDPKKTPNGSEWNKPENLRKLRIADFSCGTGTLLSTVYQRIGQLHEFGGGRSDDLHPDMMASVLVGCDILPAAAHLTASMLAMSHPEIIYKKSAIFNVLYGDAGNGEVALGSINLLDDSQGELLEAMKLNANLIDVKGEVEVDTWKQLPHKSFDVVVMNPPYTRSTNHEGQHENIHMPMFAAFNATPELQKKMADKSELLTKNTSAHGNAGEASIFLALADRKLKPGGILALVMPATLLSGESWEKSRELLAKNYEDLIFISISGNQRGELSFSADTGMAECLVIGRKNPNQQGRAHFVSLRQRPGNITVGNHAANEIRQLLACKTINRLEDGPMGGTQIKFGGDVIGQIIDAPLPISGGWRLVRMADLSLAQTAYQLAEYGKIWLPRMKKSNTFLVNITKIKNIAKIGPVHRDINESDRSGKIRGPFNIEQLQPGDVPTYPVLWAHEAGRERTLKFAPDRKAMPKYGVDEATRELIRSKAEAIWDTASHCHFNTDFQFNSQSTAMQFTPKPAIGGTAWPSIKLPTVAQEKALVLWANTSLGFLLHWWHASKQQSGRGRVPKTALATLPVLDVSQLSVVQLDEATRLFDEFAEIELQPFNLIDRDVNRAVLDARFCTEILGLPPEFSADGGPLSQLREKLA